VFEVNHHFRPGILFFSSENAHVYSFEVKICPRRFSDGPGVPVTISNAHVKDL
jgi:hypothetical protein